MKFPLIQSSFKKRTKGNSRFNKRAVSRHEIWKSKLLKKYVGLMLAWLAKVWNVTYAAVIVTF